MSTKSKVGSWTPGSAGGPPSYSGFNTRGHEPQPDGWGLANAEREAREREKLEAQKTIGRLDAKRGETIKAAVAEFNRTPSIHTRRGLHSFIIEKLFLSGDERVLTDHEARLLKGGHYA